MAKLHHTSLSESDIVNITYRIADLKTQNPIGYQSCFISYTEVDKGCAEKLHAAFQEKGVRCWFAPEDLKIGDQLIDRIDEAIHGHRRLLLLLSEAAMASPWVEREVRTALRREIKEDGDVLFPIRLDNAVMESDVGWAAEIRETRHIGDFREWETDTGFQQGFDRLTRDLIEETQPHPPHFT